MSNVNPAAGGPAFIVALRNSLEERDSEFKTPPRTGGKQQSIRLDDALMRHVDVISKFTSWNRTEILATLIQRGLYDLYEITNEHALSKVRNELAYSFEDAILWHEARQLLHATLSYFSKRNHDVDDWECANLEEAIDAFRSGQLRYALSCTKNALVTHENRSKDPAYTKLVPPRTKNLKELKAQFELEV